MHKKGSSDGENILSSIQNLKHKLRLDQRQLQQIKHGMSRGRSTSIIKDKPNPRMALHDDKQNQEALANVPRQQFRRCKGQQEDNKHSQGSPDNRMIELRKQHKAQLKQVADQHREEVEAVRHEWKQEIADLKEYYENIIREKDSHIRALEETLQAQVYDENVNRSFDSEAIKEHYEQEIRRIKASYETIINNLSEQNQQLADQLKTQRSEEPYNDLTFKNVRLALKNSSRLDVPNHLQARIAESHNTSIQMQDDLSHKDTVDRESTKTSRLSNSSENGLLRKFKDKFKFVKKSGGSVNNSACGSLQSSMIHEYRIDQPRNREEPTSSDYGRLNDLSRRCTLQEAWQSWIGSEITEETWEDRQVQGEQNLMQTIRNIKASLPS